MDENKKKSLEDALYKIAVGFETTDESVEYVVNNEGAAVPVRKKVTVKNVPPELAAVKALLADDRDGELDSMSEEELLKEKETLLKEIKGDFYAISQRKVQN